MPRKSIESDVDTPHAKRVNYTDKEMEQRSRIREEADHANTQRAQSWMELDDMDYETWYERAKKAVNAYIEPKRNEEDVKVVTGTTREKSNTIVSTLLSYNLECDIVAYDENDNMNKELGDAMEKMVRKSRELELPRYEIKRPLIYNEIVGAGTVHVRESLDEYSIPQKELEEMEWSEDIAPDKIKWKDKLAKVYSYCNSTMLTGLECYPGDMRQYFLELQPYFIVRKVVNYATAKSMYNKWERFKYVPKQLQISTELEHDLEYDDFQMVESEVDYVEIIEYYNKWKNEYQILLNGVMMLPTGFPMSAIIGVCEYPISKGDGEMISPNFYYSRGIGAKTRMDQALIDEMYKMMIIKTRKSYKPPMSDRGNYNIGPTVYMPGKIFKGIDPEKLQPIGENGGVTPAEFNMTQFVKGVIDEKTMSSIMEGQAPSEQATARQIIEQKEQSMMKLGNIMLGVINLEQRMAWMRIYNILKNWTEPIDTRYNKVKKGMEKIYRTISVDDTLENGREGEKIIDLREDVPDDSQVFAEEEILSEVRQKPVRKIIINPEMLKSLKYTWQVIITPTEKNTDDLKAAMFKEFLMDVFGIFAPLGKMPNMDFLADRFAQVNSEDPEQVWQQEQPQAMPGMPPGGGQPGMPPGMGAPGGPPPPGAMPPGAPGPGTAQQLAPQGQNKPSVKAMV